MRLAMAVALLVFITVISVSKIFILPAGGVVAALQGVLRFNKKTPVSEFQMQALLVYWFVCLWLGEMVGGMTS